MAARAPGCSHHELLETRRRCIAFGARARIPANRLGCLGAAGGKSHRQILRAIGTSAMQAPTDTKDP